MEKKISASELAKSMTPFVDTDDDGKVVVDPDVFFVGMSDEDKKGYKDAIDLSTQVDKVRLPAMAIAIGGHLVRGLTEDPTAPTSAKVPLYGGRHLQIGATTMPSGNGDESVAYQIDIGMGQPKPISTALKKAASLIRDMAQGGETEEEPTKEEEKA